MLVRETPTRSSPITSMAVSNSLLHYERSFFVVHLVPTLMPRPADTTVISADRAWLLPLMKTSSLAAQSPSPNLGLFQSKILILARQCDAFGALRPSTATFFHRARVIDLWSLFPCFCQRPTDLEATFPSLSQTLVRAMGDARYPELVVSEMIV